MAKSPRKPRADELIETVGVARWAGPVFILCSLVLIPWIVYLALTLPSRAVSHHNNIAWVGYDIMELLALAATGLFAFRQSRHLALAAAAAATLLIIDAWFDVLTSPRHELPTAILLAVVIELPLAAVCGWISYHTETLMDQRLTLLLRRRQPRARRPAGHQGSG